MDQIQIDASEIIDDLSLQLGEASKQLAVLRAQVNAMHKVLENSAKDKQPQADSE